MCLDFVLDRCRGVTMRSLSPLLWSSELICAQTPQKVSLLGYKPSDRLLTGLEGSAPQLEARLLQFFVFVWSLDEAQDVLPPK